MRGSTHFTGTYEDTQQIEIQPILIYYSKQVFSYYGSSNPPMKNGHCADLCLALQTAVNKQVRLQSALIRPLTKTC